MPVILKLNFLFDDGRFRSLAKCLIGEDATTKDLADLFNKLHKKSEVCLSSLEKKLNV